MSWEKGIMPKIHPRRNAREGVLEALFASQFSNEKPDIILGRLLESDSRRLKNSKFYM